MPRIISELEQDEYWLPAPRSCCYEGGDVIITFDGERSHGMVAHSEVLAAAGDFFGGGAKEAWSSRARTAIHPQTRQEFKVLEYKLVHKAGDNVAILDTTLNEGDMLIDNQFNRTITSFCRSTMASGFLRREQDDWYDEKEDGYYGDALAVQREHEAAFSLLFEQECSERWLNYENIANIVAYTEFYGFFHLIVVPLREILLRKTDLWSDVKENYKFHLSLAAKLRCEPVYCDAVRHYIGSGTSIHYLTTVGIDAEAILDIVMKREYMQGRLANVRSEIESLTLAPYIPHANTEIEGDLARTTYLSSISETTVLTRSQDIARRNVRELLTLHLSGDPHWSHIREAKDGAGYFYQSSLRNFCTLAVEARQTGTELELFDKDIVKAHVDECSLFKSDQKSAMTHFINDEIKKLINEIANIAWPYIAPQDWKPMIGTGIRRLPAAERFRGLGSLRALRGHGDESYEPAGGCGIASHAHDKIEPRWTAKFPRYGFTAKDDQDCLYFTCVPLSSYGPDHYEGRKPWEDDFEKVRIEGLRPAGKMWLATIGYLEDGEMDELTEMIEAGVLSG